jgi:hypothetical protein
MKVVQPWPPDFAVIRVVGLLVADGGVLFDGPKRNPEILRPVAEGQKVAEAPVDLRFQMLVAAGGSVIAERPELPEEGRVGLEDSVGIDRDHKDLTRRIAENTIEIECEDVHGGRV